MRVIGGDIPTAMRTISGELLRKFITDISGINAVLISTVDGFEIASQSTDRDHVTKLSALSSTLSAIGNMASLETDIGKQYRNVTIESDNGFLVIMDIEYKAYPMIFCIVASKEALLAKVIQQAKKIINIIISKLPL